MRILKTLSFLTLVTVLMFVLPARAQQKPFSQEQVISMVRDGFGDESGAKLIEQRGIDFAPSEDFIQSLKAAGASEAFLNALRAAKPSVRNALTWLPATTACPRRASELQYRD
jgi:hypothetical protein